MKKMIFVLLVMVALMGCEPFMRSETISVEIAGSGQANLFFMNNDYGLVDLPITITDEYGVNNLGSGDSAYNCICTSTANFTVTIKEDGVTVYTETTNDLYFIHPGF